MKMKTKMKMNRVIAAAALSISMLAPALADSFPSKTITIVVPYPPGGTSDIVPRALAPKMQEALGVPVIIDNRGGANGSLGAAYVAKSAPDGHTILMTPTGVLAINQWLYKKLVYNPEKDLIPIINSSRAPNILVVNPNVPARTLSELIALAKAKPNSLSFASQGNGSTGHMCGELLNQLAGIEMQHIPYKGSAPAIQDVIGGQVPLMCENFSNAIPHVRGNRLRALAVTAKTRSTQAPEIPTAQEAGLANFDAGVWYGFAAPAGTPKPIIDKLNAVMAKALHSPDVTSRLAGLGLTVVADTPEQFAAFVAAESAKWRKVVQTSGATID
jgi:tripartite-type tricarboxylate transporter receptor subunit TctC